MKFQPVEIIFGFGGMHEDENEKARKYAARFEPFMLIVAIWILLEWYLSSKELIPPGAKLVGDWIIWTFFLIETVVLSKVATKPLRYLLRNWAHVVIIVLAIPFVNEAINHVGGARIIRLVLLFGFMTHNFKTVKSLLSQNQLGKTLLGGAVLITTSGILISTIDPGIESPMEGVWWAWVTVTTVGYGDIVPVSSEGRAFASILILVGIVLVSFITANLSAYLLSKDVEQEIRYEQHELRRLVHLEHKIDALEEKIDRLLENQNINKTDN